MKSNRASGFPGGLDVTGITGGMGSGKSSAARFLCRGFSLVCLSADVVVHELLEPGGACWDAVRNVNRDFLADDGRVNKPRLREALFADHALRDQVNRAMHPLVREELITRVARSCGTSSSRHFLIEVPLLFEAGWLDLFSRIIVVYARSEQCMARVAMRDGVSFAQARLSIAAQMPLGEKALLADHVVDNSGMWSDTMLQLVRLGSLFWDRASGEWEKVGKKS